MIDVKKEILNSTLHVLMGGILCYAFIPRAELWILVCAMAGVGAVREWIQILRGHKQIWWIKYLDAGGFVVGAVIYYLTRHIWLHFDKLKFAIGSDCAI